MNSSANIIFSVIVACQLGCSVIGGSNLRQAAANQRGPADQVTVALPSVAETIAKAQANCVAEQKSDGTWDFPSYLGSFYVSQYLLFKQWIGMSDDPGQIQTHLKFLLDSQRSDGSWFSIEDKIVGTGDINATVWNYLFVKKYQEQSVTSKLISGLEIGRRLTRARQWILQVGGAEEGNMLTKMLLAASGAIDWQKKIIPIPTLILNDNSMFAESWNFGQWVGPHLKPLAVLRHHKFVRSIGVSATSILLDPDFSKKNIPRAVSAKDEQRTLRFLMPLQQPAGSWGGYTLATMFNIMALTTAGKMSLEDPAIKKGIKFIEDRYFANGAANHLGATQDGRYWDTILVGQALLESGAKQESLIAAADAVVRVQSKNGGLAFGVDFEYAPDVDDTAEMITFLQHFGSRYEAAIKHGEKFIYEMQNSDGGWAAFAKNNTGYGLFKKNDVSNFVLEAFKDSVAFFDESSPDVTGHALEGLGLIGQTKEKSKVVQAAVKYLKVQQNKNFGGWTGRWGVNFIYGTSAVLVGLHEVKEDMGAAYIQKAVQWLKSVQRPDGSFGETTLSYFVGAGKNEQGFAGKGYPTPSQTAWALLALVAAGEARSESANKAAYYLQAELQKNGKWTDLSTVGTGHPGIVYMNYPSYPYAFPLLALSKYQKAQ